MHSKWMLIQFWSIFIDNVEIEGDTPEEEILSVLDVPPGKMGRVIGRKGAVILSIKQSCKYISLSLSLPPLRLWSSVFLVLYFFECIFCSAEILMGGDKGPPDKVSLSFFHSTHHCFFFEFIVILYSMVWNNMIASPFWTALLLTRFRIFLFSFGREKLLMHKIDLLLIILWFSCIGIYHRTSQAGEESGSYVKGKNAGHVIANLCCASIILRLYK